MTATNKQLQVWADRLRSGSLHLRNKCPKAALSLSEIAGEMEKAAKPVLRRFVPPTLDEWMAYSGQLYPPYAEQDAEAAWNHYVANGWMVGRNKMKDWKAACRTCHARWKRETPGITLNNTNVKKGTMYELDRQLKAVDERLNFLKNKCPGPHASLADFLSEAEKDEWGDLQASKKKLEQKIREF